MSDQYEKFETIGQGRHTVIYEGHDHGPLDRAIAVKELADCEDSRRLKSFLAEAKFLANLDHEHLLKVFDVDPTSNMVITELLEGSLDQLIKQQGPMGSDRVRSVMQQALKALNYLHKKNIIFGALRPSKLMYSYRGKVRLGSFEKIGDGVVPRPEFEKYVAPETLNVAFGDVGPALDFYCLGFTSLELLLGDRFDDIFPVMSEDSNMAKVDWLRWHGSEDEIPPARKLVPRIADDLAAALDRMLQKNVSQRPQSALEVFSLLQDIDPIPVIDGVEQSIRFGSRKQFSADAKAGDSLVGRAAANPGQATSGSAPNTQGKGAQCKTAKKSEQPKGRPQQPGGSAKGLKTRTKKSSGLRSLIWALPLLIGLSGIAFGGWWVYQNDPWGWLQPTETVASLPVEFQFSPEDIGDVSVTKNGEPIIQDDQGKWLLPAGAHKLEFSAGEFQASKNFNVDADNRLFQIRLAKADKTEQPTEPDSEVFEKRFTVDPRRAELEIAGDKLDLENGFGTRAFPSSEAGKSISVVATAAGYQDYRQEIELQPDAITHITMAPWLIVDPKGADVQLAGAAIEKNEEGLYPLPRLETKYELKVSKEGYLPFTDSGLTFESLRTREFKVKLVPDFARLYAIGEQALNNRQFDSAIDSFTVVLEHDDEKYFKGYLLRGKTHQLRTAEGSSQAAKDNDALQAIADFTSFLTRGELTATAEEKAEAYLRRASIHRSGNRISEAISDFRSSDKHRPNSEVKTDLANLLMTRAKKYAGSDDLPSAIADMEEARKLAPQLPGIDVALASIRFRYGNNLMVSRNLGAAKREFDGAIELQNEKPEFYIARGECNGSMNHDQDGIQDYTAAIGMTDQPKSQWLLGRASLHQKLDDLEKAILDYNQAIQLAPDDPTAYLRRGQLYRRKLKDFPKAIKDFRQALANHYSPTFDVKLEIGQAFHDWGELEFSQAHFSEAITQFTASVDEFQSIEQATDLSDHQKTRLAEKMTDTYCRLADGYNASKDYPGAVEQYSIAIKRGGPKDKVALARRGNCYKSLGKFGEAEADLQAALKLDSSYASAKFYWGQLKVKSGDAIARSRIGEPPSKQEELKSQAVLEYRSAIEMLEGLVATKKEVRYYELIITACSRINVLDTNQDNASLLKKWRELKQKEFFN